MPKKNLPACAKCPVEASKRACRIDGGVGPNFCPTKKMTEIVQGARKKYQEANTNEFARQASIQEAECYKSRDVSPYVRNPVKPRLQETCEFADKMGYKRLGLAYCAGLQSEAAALTKVPKVKGFEVASVICKVGCTPKEEIGVKDEEKVRIGQFESMCSPVAQAEVLNSVATEFNIILGLCVGHDSLFFKHAEAPTTVFAVKDRVLGHNPLAAIYTLSSSSERFLK